MLKMFVTKAVKAAWDNASSAPAEETTTTESSHQVVEEEELVEVAVTAESLGIELPYYPGEGTACGSDCRCSWQIEVRWSSKHGANATFATWVTSDDSDVCLDCEQRLR